VILLRPIELAYQGVNRLRRSLYRRGVLRQKELPRPVVSIGNLSIGGSGKTPVTIALVRLLRERGFSPAVLTRGYRRKSNESWAVVTGGDVARFGDEPVMMAAALPETPVIVGADRYQAAIGYLQGSDCDLFVLDDGFQHLRLLRDCDVVIDHPARWAREGRAALRDAGIILRRGIRRSSALSQTIFEMELVVNAVRRGGHSEPPEVLRGAKVVAFAGLADNRQFFALLEHLGARLVATFEFADHHRYSRQELERIRRAAAEAPAMMVTTAKDWVKLVDPEIAFLEVEMEIARSAALVDEILSRCGLPRERGLR
jgi:tetraacyldisaccharide 4'-kinase